MQHIESNWVFIVDLEKVSPSGIEKDWDFFIKENHFFYHPIDKSWPERPPNYIGFLKNNSLQSIHHIEKYEVFNNPNLVLAELPDTEWNPHYLYHLGKAFKPCHKMAVDAEGTKFFWSMLDTLFTKNALSEAVEESIKRVREHEQKKMI